MSGILRSLDGLSMGALLCIAFVLYAVSEKTAQGTQARVWGQRVCIGIFLFCLLLGILAGGLTDAGLIIRVSFRGILMGASIGGATTLFLLVACWVWQRTVGRAILRWERWKTERKAARDRQERQQLDLIESQSRYEETQIARRQEESRHQQIQRGAEQQIQRDELKFQVQVHYETHRSEIEHRLPAERMASLLSDSFRQETPMDQCLQRAQTLKELVESHLPGGSREAAEFTDLESVVRHYSERKRQLQALDLDEDMTETLEVVLDEAQEKAMREFFS